MPSYYSDPASTSDMLAMELQSRCMSREWCGKLVLADADSGAWVIWVELAMQAFRGRRSAPPATASPH
jgi:hypothetical protein